MSNQNDNNNSNNNTTSNDSNDTYEGMELFIEDIRRVELTKESNKRERDDDNDSEEPKSKRQREYESDKSDDILSESSSESSDSVSDEGEVSETDRINTKYSKRFDAIEDYKEKNELLSEVSIQDVMSKLDRGETVSEQEFETLQRANRLMDQDILKDKDSLQRMQLYEDFSSSIQKEISENNARIERHEEKISEYLARLEELNNEDNETSSDNESNLENNDSNDNNSVSNNPSNSPEPNDSSGLNNPSDPNDDDGFDDFPPSFDFDDF